MLTSFIKLNLRIALASGFLCFVGACTSNKTLPSDKPFNQADYQAKPVQDQGNKQTSSAPKPAPTTTPTPTSKK